MQDSRSTRRPAAHRRCVRPRPHHVLFPPAPLGLRRRGVGPAAPPPLFLGQSAERPCSLPLVQASASAVSGPVLHPDGIQGARGEREAGGEKGPHAGLPDQGGEMSSWWPSLAQSPVRHPRIPPPSGMLGQQVGHGSALAPAGLTSACTPAPPPWGATGRLPRGPLGARVETV